MRDTERCNNTKMFQKLTIMKSTKEIPPWMPEKLGTIVLHLKISIMSSTNQCQLDFHHIYVNLNKQTNKTKKSRHVLGIKLPNLMAAILHYVHPSIVINWKICLSTQSHSHRASVPLTRDGDDQCERGSSSMHVFLLVYLQIFLDKD